jgi:hypothetical protein
MSVAVPYRLEKGPQKSREAARSVPGGTRRRLWAGGAGVANGPVLEVALRKRFLPRWDGASSIVMGRLMIDGWRFAVVGAASCFLNPSPRAVTVKTPVRTGKESSCSGL